MRIHQAITTLGALFATAATAQTGDSRHEVIVQTGGISALWMLSNLCYAGMRAQGSSSAGWRIVAFIFGFPGTLVSYFVVKEAGERAYGVDLPRRPRP